MDRERTLHEIAGRVVGERLIFAPEPLPVRLRAIALAVLFGLVMVGGSALITLALLFGVLKFLKEGPLGALLLCGFLAALVGWVGYFMALILCEFWVDCVACNWVVDRQQQKVLRVYKGRIMAETSFGGADRLMCQYVQGPRGSSSYRIVAGVGDDCVRLCTASPLKKEGVRAVQEKSIAIAEFLELPLTFVRLGQNDFLQEPGASYNRKMTQEREHQKGDELRDESV